MADVVDLRTVRARVRVEAWRQKVERVMESNRRTIGKLYATGALFSRQGSRVGRDLLLAHQHLLKVNVLLDRLSDDGDVPAPRKPAEREALYRELDALLDKTQAITHRSGDFLARLRRE